MGLSRKLSIRKTNQADASPTVDDDTMSNEIALSSPRRSVSKLRQKSYRHVVMGEPEKESPRRSVWRQLSMKRGLSTSIITSAPTFPSDKPSLVTVPCSTDDESESGSLKVLQQQQEQEKQAEQPRPNFLDHIKEHTEQQAQGDQLEESCDEFSVTDEMLAKEQNEEEKNDTEEDDVAPNNSPAPQEEETVAESLLSPTPGTELNSDEEEEILCQSPTSKEEPTRVVADNTGNVPKEYMYQSPPRRRKSSAMAAAAASVLTPRATPAAPRSTTMTTPTSSPTKKRYFRMSRHTSTDKEELAWSLSSYKSMHSESHGTLEAPVTPSHSIRRSSLSMGAKVPSTTSHNVRRSLAMGEIDTSTPLNSMKLSKNEAEPPLPSQPTTPSQSMRRSSLSMNEIAHSASSYNMRRISLSGGEIAPSTPLQSMRRSSLSSLVRWVD